MKPIFHANSSAKKYGGIPSDYDEIHTFIDSSKQTYAGLAHRAILHSVFGIFLVEKVFGPRIINSDGKEVAVRDIAEQHVFEDIGFIPSVQDWLEDLPVKTWMHGKPAAKKTMRRLNQLNEILNYERV